MDLLAFSTPPRTAAEAHALAEASGALCRECPLYGCKRGPVMGEIVPNALLTVIGEAPGNKEVESGAPFSGPSGVELDQSLAQGGVARGECTITNVLLCQPPEDFDDYMERLNREHRKASADAEAAGQPPPHAHLTPIGACAPRLDRDIRISNSKVFLAVGGKALRELARRYQVPYGEEA